MLAKSSFHTKEALLSGFQTDPVPLWQQVRGVQLNRKRSHHGCVILDDNRILVVGGYEKKNDSSSEVLRSVEVFDRPTKKWDKKWPKLTQHRAEHAAVKVGNLLYVMGGRGSNGQCLDSIECLDLSQKKSAQNYWVTLDIKLSSKKRGCTAVVVGSLVYVMGGRNDDDNVVGSVDILDFAMHKLHPGPALQRPRFGSAAVLLEESDGGGGAIIYVIGGQDGSGRALDTIEFLKVSPERKRKTSSSWQAFPETLTTPRVFPAATGVAHCLLVIGGTSSNINENSKVSSSVVEVVDTKRDVIWPCAGLNQAVQGGTAVTLDESRVGLLGGCCCSQNSSQQQILNTMQVVQLEFCSHETHISAVEKELKEVRSGGGGSLKKMLGRGGSKNKPKNASKLKAFLKELKSQGSARDDTYDSEDESVGDIDRYFENGYPTYDSGRIVAKKQLKESGQARVFKRNDAPQGR